MQNLHTCQVCVQYLHESGMKLRINKRNRYRRLEKWIYIVFPMRDNTMKKLEIAREMSYL